MGWKEDVAGEAGMMAVDEFMKPATSQLLFGYLYSQGLDFDDTDHLPKDVKRALRIFQNIVGRLLAGHDGSFGRCDHPVTLEQFASNIPVNLDN